MSLFGTCFKENPKKAAIDSIKVVAHDLRNPAISIKAFSEILLKESKYLKKEHIEFVEIINQTSKLMLDLMNELLDLSKIEENKFEIDKNSINIQNLVKNQAKLYRPALEEKHILLEENYQEIPEIMADRKKISCVVDNILSNAVKYSFFGSKINVSVEKEFNNAVISVKDGGPGISQPEQQKLFQQYAKLSPKPTGNEKSTGLGLAISKRIVEMHGGYLEYENSPEGGSVFKVYLPLTRI